MMRLLVPVTKESSEIKARMLSVLNLLPRVVVLVVVRVEKVLEVQV